MANQTMDAIFFLCDILRDGRMCLSDIHDLAERRGVKRRTLQRAADHLEIRKTTRGFGPTRHSVWSIDRATAERYRDERFTRIKMLTALDAALAKATIYTKDFLEAEQRLKKIRRDIRRERDTLKHKGVYNFHR